MRLRIPSSSQSCKFEGKDSQFEEVESLPFEFISQCLGNGEMIPNGAAELQSVLFLRGIKMTSIKSLCFASIFRMPLRRSISMTINNDFCDEDGKRASEMTDGERSDGSG